MRAQSGWVVPAAFITGIVLTLPLTAAQGAPAHPLVKPVLIDRNAGVTLPTGEQVRLTGKPGRQGVLVDHLAGPGPGRALVTRRIGSHVYVMPAVAEPYLGRRLDPSLFDVTTLKGALDRNGRLPVRISYRGGAPTVPGVQITSASAGTARGFLTRSSAAAFGRAITAQWTADSKAHWPARTTLFPGVTSISADQQPPPKVTPMYPMYTLVIKAVGADGKPQPFGLVGLMNVDDGRKYGAFVFTENGEARVSVPKGTYSAIGDDFTFDEATETGSERITTVNEFKVVGSGQTLTIDHRKATARPTVRVPRPAELLENTVEWDRVDAAQTSRLGFGSFLDPSISLTLAPAAKAKKGTAALIQNWVLAEPKTQKPAYNYNLAVLDDHIAAKPLHTFAPAKLAVIHAAYYGDGTTSPAAFLRYPTFALGGGDGAFDVVPRASRRTEYVGSIGNPSWTDVAIINDDALEDPGFVDGPERMIHAGSTHSIDWFRGPLGAAIPTQQNPGFCLGCRFGNTISVGLAPFTDSVASHAGEMFGAEDGLPVARFRLYRNGKLISDTDDSLGGDFSVSAAKATYTAVLDFNRRLSTPAQSTQSKTELTFSSARGAGKKLPSSWDCDGDNCRVLPIVQARVGLPTDLNGRLPAGKSVVTVTVAQAQKATKAKITSAGLAYRPAGWSWSTVKLKAIGGGKYRGVIDNRDFSGLDVDLRVSGGDVAGSSFKQTVLRAYTVAES